MGPFLFTVLDFSGEFCLGLTLTLGCGSGGFRGLFIFPEGPPPQRPLLTNFSPFFAANGGCPKGVAVRQNNGSRRRYTLYQY